MLQGVRLKSSASSSLDSQAAGPLFREWVSLAGTTALESITSGATAITKDDALVVIDMQRDFVPASINNPDGGRFGVAEGLDVVAPICSMIKAASDVGAVILASRDYHPNDHCSFSSYGGHFPSHCVAGTSGAQFLPEISEALESAMEKNGPDRVLIAFKGMHEHVDSFGALPYAREPFGDGRVPKAANAEPEGPGLGNFTKFGAIMGCTQDERTRVRMAFVCARGMGVRSRDGCALAGWVCASPRVGWVDGWVCKSIVFTHNYLW
jgi:hypothetical protein